MSHKLREEQELIALQVKHIGTGSADTTAAEWMNNVHRDTLNSFIGHPPLLQYASIGLGMSREQARVALIDRMIRPVDPKKVRSRYGHDYVLVAKQSQTPMSSESKRRKREEEKKKLHEEEETQFNQDLMEEQEKERNALAPRIVHHSEVLVISKGPADEFGRGPDGKPARF